MKNRKDTSVKGDFNSVAFFRKVKAKIAKELEGKTFAEKKEYIRQKLAEAQQNSARSHTSQKEDR